MAEMLHSLAEVREELREEQATRDQAMREEQAARDTALRAHISAEAERGVRQDVRAWGIGTRQRGRVHRFGFSAGSIVTQRAMLSLLLL